MSSQKNKLTKVGIIGRANVGKSTLFNFMSCTQDALVENREGVTRDIRKKNVSWDKGEFELWDTGGLFHSEGIFHKEIWEQVQFCVKQVDVLLFVVDGRSGLMPQDRQIYKLLQKQSKPLLTMVNKLDTEKVEREQMSEFYELGCADMLPISVECKYNLEGLKEWLLSHIESAEITENNSHESIRLAIWGRPNSGKSSLMNHFLGYSRSLVSNVAGTTLDSVTDKFEWQGQKYEIMDTAGWMRPARRGKLDQVTLNKTLQATENVDLILWMVDIEKSLGHVDLRVLEQVLKECKPVILVLNKVDLLTLDLKETLERDISRKLHFFKNINTAYISAKTGRGVSTLMKKIVQINQKINLKIKTSELNRFFFDVIRKAPSPVFQGKNVQLYYLTQTKQKPPAFLAFANYPEGVNPSYRRFLVNQISNHWSLKGIPLRIFIIKRKASSKRHLKSKDDPTLCVKKLASDLALKNDSES